MADQETNNEILINYETLYDILRKEKNSEELQSLDERFYFSLVDYLNNKRLLLEDSKNKTDLFSSAEKTETKTQIENIKRMIKDLIERREKKLIMLALNKSRTSSDIIDTSNLTKEEEDFFNDMVKVMDWFREGVVDKLIIGEMPKLGYTCVKNEENPSIENKEQEDSSISSNVMIRFLKPVPKFVGKELEIYGPFQEEDIANLPKEIANVLITKGRAEAID